MNKILKILITAAVTVTLMILSFKYEERIEAIVSEKVLTKF